jgi:hypothetical protein
MSVTPYSDLIVKTFRDEAIRSVTMIDDDFVPYYELCLLEPFKGLSVEKQMGTAKAAQIHKFFQSKKIVCDVDKCADYIDTEKIRKCDLVILDYHLEPDNPKKSINLIDALSKTEHMNLVVVYTREDLEKVWLEIASCLLGASSQEVVFSASPDTQAFWDDSTDSGAVVPPEWLEQISYEDLVNYAISGEGSKKTKDWFGDKYKQHGIPIVKAICERRLAKMNVTGAPKSNVVLAGKNEDQKWLQTGNVFVILHKKSTEENLNEPVEIWDSIKYALVDWQPSYYQLFISEMQNCLENEPIPFATNLKYDLEGQTAWLYQILSKSEDAERQLIIKQLLDRLNDELKSKLYENEKLKCLIKDTFDTLAQSYKQVQEPRLIEYAANHVKLKIDACSLPNIGHALNYTLCAREFDGDYVTSGTILYDKDNGNNWYLCVAPACETVPLQRTGHLAKKLSPHRLMKVIILQKADIKDALAAALESNHIFVKAHNDVRKAFSVINKSSRQPVIDYAFIQNHDNSTKSISEEGITVSFLALDNAVLKPEEKTLIPIAQLRDIYTARYQAMASHHAGRIGVDFEKFEIPMP